MAGWSAEILKRRRAILPLFTVSVETVQTLMLIIIIIIIIMFLDTNKKNYAFTTIFEVII